MIYLEEGNLDRYKEIIVDLKERLKTASNHEISYLNGLLIKYESLLWTYETKNEFKLKGER